MTRALDADLLQEAFRRLDARLDRPVRLVLGGGAAMSAAYAHPLSTDDVDAFVARGSATLGDIAEATGAVARDLQLAPGWLNPYYETFAFVLPSDYADRLRPVFQGKHLDVLALGPEDLLLMKCFAGRQKDIGHARALLKLAKKLDVVERRLDELIEKHYPGAERAADFFDDLRDEIEA